MTAAPYPAVTSPADPGLNGAVVLRDVLIALLVIGIALNVAVFFVAIMARPRPSSPDDGTDSAP